MREVVVAMVKLTGLYLLKRKVDLQISYLPLQKKTLLLYLADSGS